MLIKNLKTQPLSPVELGALKRDIREIAINEYGLNHIEADEVWQVFEVDNLRPIRHDRSTDYKEWKNAGGTADFIDLVDDCVRFLSFS